MVHICGNSTPLLNEILEIRPHALSLEEKVNLRKAKEVLGGKICIAGNVSPTGVFLSAADRSTLLKRLRRVWKPGEMIRVISSPWAAIFQKKCRKCR